MRLVVAALSGLLVTIWWATPALAHAGGLGPLNQRTVVVSPVDDARVIDNGTQLSYTNNSDTPVTLRLGTGPLRVPPHRSVRFRDRRAAADVGAPRSWQIATGPGAIIGRVESVDGPNPLPWLALIAALATLGALAGRLVGPPLALGAFLVAVAQVVHVVGSVFAVTGQAFMPLFVGASGVGLICWPLALAGVALALRRSPHAVFVALVVGGILVVAGFPDISSWWNAQLPFAWSADLDRALIAVVIGGGAGLVLGGIAALQRQIAP